MSLGASYGTVATPRRQYIATVPFVNDLFTYTTTTDANGLTTGTLSAVSGANPATCPAGRVLRDNGKRLYPNAHPNITYAMVGVFDPQTFLSGFINPNSPTFAMFNSDKAYFTDNLGDGYNAGFDSNLSSIVSVNQGLAVYTQGNVVSGKQVYSQTRTLLSNVGTPLPLGTVTTSNINVANGQVFYVMNPASDITLNALNCSTVGTHAYVFLSNATAVSSLTFGAGFRPTTHLSSGVISQNMSSLGAGKVSVAHFMGDGYGMTEVSRSERWGGTGAS